MKVLNKWQVVALGDLVEALEGLQVFELVEDPKLGQGSFLTKDFDRLKQELVAKNPKLTIVRVVEEHAPAGLESWEEGEDSEDENGWWDWELPDTSSESSEDVPEDEPEGEAGDSVEDESDGESEGEADGEREE